MRRAASETSAAVARGADITEIEPGTASWTALLAPPGRSSAYGSRSTRGHMRRPESEKWGTARPRRRACARHPQSVRVRGVLFGGGADIEVRDHGLHAADEGSQKIGRMSVCSNFGCDVDRVIDARDGYDGAGAEGDAARCAARNQEK